jgi:predicted dehydrogenase
VNKTVSIVLVGIGGYGNLYVDTLLDNAELRGLTFAGVVNPFPEGCRRLSEINEKNIPIFETLESFYKTKQADLAVISSPIHFHKDQSCLALSYGSNVLCEKPVAASSDEANQMIKAKEDNGKFLAIGHQWSYSRSVLNLKKHIMEGKLGYPKKLKTIVLWPRNRSYYSRKWAGRIKDDEGRLILDSVVSNATAHYLHNMFSI